MKSTKAKQPEQHLLDGYGNMENRQQGELIYTPEQPENHVFYLIEGYVRLVNCEHNATKIVGPGEFFGDRALFYSDKVYTEALSTIRYIRIDESTFRQLMYRNTKEALEITTNLSKHSIYLKQKPSLFSRLNEIFNHLRKGHSLKYWFVDDKKNTLCSCR